jgi:hypothetical protein
LRTNSDFRVLGRDGYKIKPPFFVTTAQNSTAKTYTIAPAQYQSDTSDASPLDKPLKFEFSGKRAKNRFLKADMMERISSWDPKGFKARGIPSENLINVYKRWVRLDSVRFLPEIS